MNPTVPPPITCRLVSRKATVLANLGDILSFTGRLPEASDVLHRAVALHRDAGNARGEARALRPLGNLSRLLGRYDDAEAYAHRMISLAGQIGDQVAENNGYVSAAVRHLETGLGLARQAGYRMGEHVARPGLGNVLRDLGRYGESIEQCGESLAWLRSSGTGTASSRPPGARRDVPGRWATGRGARPAAPGGRPRRRARATA